MKKYDSNISADNIIKIYGDESRIYKKIKKIGQYKIQI
jgi:hypothetical protein